MIAHCAKLVAAARETGMVKGREKGRIEEKAEAAEVIAQLEAARAEPQGAEKGE
jgi:hypothetical protein